MALSGIRQLKNLGSWPKKICPEKVHEIVEKLTFSKELIKPIPDNIYSWKDKSYGLVLPNVPNVS